jgi:predicted phosphodiesterase
VRVFALSDIHIDFKENRDWLFNLSRFDYRDDILILAGDIADMTPLFEWAFRELASRFHEVMFVPGNHDLWNYRNDMPDSLSCFNHIRKLALDHGVGMDCRACDRLTIVPLYGWYDYSFGTPSEELAVIWMDYRACRWPEHFDAGAITRHFTDMNLGSLSPRKGPVITFSHFMPRIDLMPSVIPPGKRVLYPVLGTHLLEDQVRAIRPQIHIYGHTHVNQSVEKDGIRYINNAFGYPREKRIARKELLCVMDI